MFLLILFEIVRVCNTCKYRDISEAIESVKPYDTVEVFGGKYEVINLIIDKPIALIGKNSPILDGKNRDEIVIVNADSVIIKGFTFKGSGFGFVKDFSALKVKNCNGCVIEKNIFKNNMWSIYLENSRNVVIKDNYVDGGKVEKAATYSGNGIHAWRCERIYINGNTILNHRDGIYFEFVKNADIRNNKLLSNARYGIHLMFSDNVKIYENLIYANGAIAIMYSKGFKFFSNRVERHWGSSSYGLLLKDASFGEIFGNYFYKNTYGIVFDGANSVETKNNAFIYNGYALRIWANSSKIVIKDNDFLGNTFDVTVNGFRIDAIVDGNYYDTYEGYDLNGDGYGDIPHRLVKLFSIFMEFSPVFSLFLKSPIQYFLERIEKLFPTIIPSIVEDKKPRMRKMWIYYRNTTYLGFACRR